MNSINISIRAVSSIPRKPGVYCLIYPKYFRRALKTDKEGILYIGSTKNLHDRIGLLVTGLLNGSNNHSATWTYELYFKVRLGGKIKTDKMTVLWKVFKSDYKKNEKMLLQKYCSQFGDMPPFNSSREREKDDKKRDKINSEARKMKSVISHFR